MASEDPSNSPAQRFQALKDLFQQAWELPEQERTLFLDRHCATDRSLRFELERMLAAETEDGAFLERDELDDSPRIEVIGPYRLLRPLGEGGMGIVYEAEQDEPRRKVALKVLRSGQASETFHWRFQYEVQVLARLNHPAIAKVFDSGVHVTPSGLRVPYFAMEYVEGAKNILEYAADLDLDERLQLFLGVCGGIEHGHRHGIVHRDLKPMNVLVDGDGHVRVIDFGVARILESEEEQLTRTGEIVGTLTRMSPEQLSGRPEAIDTRTDVYALGLILFELLYERFPFPVEGLSWTAIVQLIRTESPPEPHQLSSKVPRDLGWIALKAMEKDPDRRYASVSEMVRDIQRYLAHEPVVAGPPSSIYKLRKLVRRHRVAIAASAAVLLALTGGTVAATVGMLRALRAEADSRRSEAAAKQSAELAKAAEAEARQAEADAKAEASRARIMRELSDGILSSIDVYRFGADVSVVELIKATRFDHAALQEQPMIEASFRLMLADRLLVLGETTLALEHYDRVHDLAQATTEAPREMLLQAKSGQAMALGRLRRVREARELMEETIEEAETHLGPDDPWTFRMRCEAVSNHQAPGTPGRREELLELWPRATELFGAHSTTSLALAQESLYELTDAHLYQEAIDASHEHVQALVESLEPDDPRILFARRQRAILRRLNGDLVGCEQELDEILPAWLQRFGRESQHSGDLMGELIKVKRILDHHDEAIALARRELDLRLNLTGDEGEHAALALYEMAELLRDTGQLEEAEPYYLRACDALAAVFGEGDIRTLNSRATLGRLWSELDRPEEGLELLMMVVEDTERIFGPDHRMMVEFVLLASNLAEQTDPEMGFAMAQRAAELSRKTIAPSDPMRIYCVINYGSLLVEHEDYAAAEPLLLEVLENAPDIAPLEASRRLAAQGLADLYERTDRPQQAATYRALLQPE